MYASIAHDIGKIAIADSILRKPGPLEGEEWERMKAHTIVGAQLLAAFLRLAPKLDTEVRASFTRERGSVALRPMAV